MDERTVVTNFHVIDQLRYSKASLCILTKSGKDIPFKRVRNFSIPYDLALLEVERHKQLFLELGSIFTDTVYVLGFPKGRFNKFNGRNISTQDENHVFLINSVQDLNSASGSPMLNAKGQVIGVFHSSFEVEKDLQTRQGRGTQVKHLKDLLKKYPLPFEKQTI